MKKFIFSTIILFLTIIASNAQIPQFFDYQAIARDSTGAVIPDQPITVRVSIIQDTLFGTPIFQEGHHISTGETGLFTLRIGQGIPLLGNFSSIDWSSSANFIKIETDISGGTNYSEMGVVQLLSVPRSLQAGSLTLIDVNGTRYRVCVDTLGNLNTTPIIP